MNNTAKDILKNSLTAAFGLFLFAFGVYLTIQANIGVGPWDVFSLGLSSALGILYGTASIAISLIIVAIDIALREKIGIGMLLDAVLVGKFVDLFNFLNIVPPQKSLFMSLIIIVAGQFIMGCAQYFYMKAALGCGPRDSLLVGLKRRIKKLPIGAISIIILASVTVIGWLLGGPIGLGTLVCVLLQGPVMQLVFSLLRFDPTGVQHQNFAESFKVLRHSR